VNLTAQDVHQAGLSYSIGVRPNPRPEGAHLAANLRPHAPRNRTPSQTRRTRPARLCVSKRIVAEIVALATATRVRLQCELPWVVSSSPRTSVRHSRSLVKRKHRRMRCEVIAYASMRFAESDWRADHAGRWRDDLAPGFPIAATGPNPRQGQCETAWSMLETLHACSRHALRRREFGIKDECFRDLP
jgi:hypothetical protein